MVINGLPLPRDLLALMEAGRWKAPVDHSGVDRLFPENGGLYLYSVELMESEMRTLFDLQVPAWHGAPDPAEPLAAADGRRRVGFWSSSLTVAAAAAELRRPLGRVTGMRSQIGILLCLK